MPIDHIISPHKVSDIIPNWVMSLFITSDISSTCLWAAVLLDAPVLLLAWLRVEVPSNPEGAQVWNSYHSGY